MALIDAIERLQQSSVQKRRIILVIAVAVSMAGVIGLWILELRSAGFASEPVTEKGPFGIIMETLRQRPQ